MTVINHTGKERARKLRARLTEAGLVQVCGWVHAGQAAELKMLIKQLQTDRDLEPCGPRHAPSGRWVKLGG